MEKMFCFQCQETAKGTGCTKAGVCGKQASTAAMMDMLLFATRGIAVVATSLRQHNMQVPTEVAHFVDDALFTTITNANFDEDVIRRKVTAAFEMRDQLLVTAFTAHIGVPAVDETCWFGRPESYQSKALDYSPMRTVDPEIRSLKELITYGLKGMAAYLEHARNLGYSDGALDAFIQRALSDITVKMLYLDELVALVFETGQHGVEAMALLDKANTFTYGRPEVTEVNLGVGTRPGILVTGHDLRDLEMLLEQTQDKGVDIYTHGEMLPAHYYPFLKKYPHLVGNYGGAWWKQREEFSAFHGPILFTTNCLVPPVDGAPYREKMFTTNSAGFPGCRHIAADGDGWKDFSPIIEMAQQCQPPAELERGTIVGGFAHDQVAKLSDKIAEAVKKGHIRKFVVMAGCDGRMHSREYYTEFAYKLPKDCIILTAGCAKYRYNKLHLGEIDGIPRVLDAGQCNDSYSWVLTAFALRDLFKVADVNELPIVYNIAWYEQKAVIVLLALLSLGIKNIHVGPTLPAFISPKLAILLKRKLGLEGITVVDDDLRLAA